VPALPEWKKDGLEVPFLTEVIAARSTSSKVVRSRVPIGRVAEFACINEANYRCESWGKKNQKKNLILGAR
jgi:hypothetical protein